jgi:serine/threonine protein phosphatase PrpC
MTVAGEGENQDRGLILPSPQGTVLCVADGAGGIGGGAAAATLATDWVRHHAAELTSPHSVTELFHRIDSAVAEAGAGGETTCALAVLAPSEVFGTSVGDSAVWLIPASGAHIDLTRGQRRKPFLGSGAAWPTPFRLANPSGMLLLATDGLVKYASPERIVSACRQASAEAAARRLLTLVQYPPSGRLPDDVTVILAPVP